MSQRLGKNLGRYHGESIPIWDVLKEIDTLAAAAGWTEDKFYTGAHFSLSAHRSPSRAGAPRVYISTGIHGDEPAGPLVVRELFRRALLPERFDLTIVPCLNPHGFLLNTRENEAGVDLNREYRSPRSPIVQAHITWLLTQSQFEAGLLLHEDWEANGFYVYELNPNNLPSLAEPMIQAVSLMAPIETSEMVDTFPCANGIIRPPFNPQERPDWAEAIWLITHRTRQNCTLETPSDFPLHFRVETQLAALQAAFKALAP